MVTAMYQVRALARRYGTVGIKVTLITFWGGQNTAPAHTTKSVTTGIIPNNGVRR